MEPLIDYVTEKIEKKFSKVKTVPAAETKEIQLSSKSSYNPLHEGEVSHQDGNNSPTGARTKSKVTVTKSTHEEDGEDDEGTTDEPVNTHHIVNYL